MKKIIALLLAALMLVSLVACTKAPADTTTAGKANDSTVANDPADDTTVADAPKETVTVKWVTIDGQPTTYDTWIKQVNEYIEPKIGVKLEVIYVDGETRNLMYQTGAEYDIMFGEGGDFAGMQEVGALAPLDEYLSEVPALMELIPSYVFDAVKVDGKICAVPAYKDYSHSEYFIWEKAIVDKYPDFKYEDVNDLQELYDAVKFLKDSGEEWPAMVMAGAFSNGIPVWDYDTADICGFVGIKYEGGTEFVSVYEQPEVKANIETIGKLYTEGYLNSDNYILDAVETNQYIVGNGWGWPSAAETSWKREGESVVVSQYLDTVLSTESVRGSVTAFNKNSAHVAEALKFIEFVNTDTYMRDLLWYGEEGVDWEWSTDYATGKPAVGVLNSSAFGGQTKSTWNKTCAILTKYGPSGKYHTAIASAPEDMTWNEHRNQRNNSHAMGYVAMAEQNNPAEVIDWTLVYNEEENERLGNLQTDIMTYVREYRAKFASGELDPHSDADWNTYVQTLNGMGTDIWLSCAQSAYDRFMAG